VVDSLLESVYKKSIGTINLAKGLSLTLSKKLPFPTYKASKEISHIFRPRIDESKDFLSPLIFSGAAGFALIIFIGLMTNAGGNIKGLTTFWSTLLLGSFSGIVFFFFLFWTCINIVQGFLLGSAILIVVSYIMKQVFDEKHPKKSKKS
jgi:Oligosaccharyltransferase subunit Ribophorin II